MRARRSLRHLIHARRTWVSIKCRGNARPMTSGCRVSYGRSGARRVGLRLFSSRAASAGGRTGFGISRHRHGHGGDRCGRGVRCRIAASATGTLPAVRVDRRMASLWFGTSLRPQGWTMPPQWDPVAGNYRARDRWIRLHTNAPHHRLAALSVLGCAADAQSVAQAVNRWDAGALEEAIVERGGCAAAMYSAQEWAGHPQGNAVATEPLLHVRAATDAVAHDWRPSKDRPLRGIRVLDLTRILAGPVATRFLAAARTCCASIRTAGKSRARCPKSSTASGVRG